MAMKTYSYLRDLICLNLKTFPFVFLIVIGAVVVRRIRSGTESVQGDICLGLNSAHHSQEGAFTQGVVAYRIKQIASEKNRTWGSFDVAYKCIITFLFDVAYM